LAGRDSHPLDDIRSFVVASPLPVPFDPQGLVALNTFYVATVVKPSVIFFLPLPDA
jgi:hypothetical protein